MGRQQILGNCHPVAGSGKNVGGGLVPVVAPCSTWAVGWFRWLPLPFYSTCHSEQTMNEDSLNFDALKDVKLGERGVKIPSVLMDAVKKAFGKPIIKSSDLPSDMYNEALDLCVAAIDKFESDYENAAKTIKETMDKKFDRTWHCIVGEDFGCACDYMKHAHMLCYYKGNVGILLFKR